MIQHSIAYFEFYCGLLALIVPIVAAKCTGSWQMLWLYMVAAPVGLLAIGAGLAILEIIH